MVLQAAARVKVTGDDERSLPGLSYIIDKWD
jgi:hypothetical protein